MAAIRNRDCGVLHSVVIPVPSSEPTIEIRTPAGGGVSSVVTARRRPGGDEPHYRITSRGPHPREPVRHRLRSSRPPTTPSRRCHPVIAACRILRHSSSHRSTRASGTSARRHHSGLKRTDSRRPTKAMLHRRANAPTGRHREGGRRPGRDRVASSRAAPAMGRSSRDTRL